jgi:predicted S18 family serine protease
VVLMMSLVSCATPGSDDAKSCASQIDIAGREYTVAGSRWARGHPTLDQVAELVRKAHRQRKAGEYQSCLQNARQARALLRSLLGS